LKIPKNKIQMLLLTLFENKINIREGKCVIPDKVKVVFASGGVRVAIWPFLKQFSRIKMIWPFGLFLAFFQS
jgi:hypothetical protein